jgi:biotin carboxyl carrier protein
MILQHGNETYTVQLTPEPDGSYTAVIGGDTLRFRAERQPDGGWLLIFADGQREWGHSASQGNERYIYVGGHHFTISVPDAHSTVQRRRQTGSGGELTAQMPGKVIDVRVQDGLAVERGQTLVILEAMKMEIRVAAPDDGRVKRVLVKVGDVVERGQRLIEIDRD